MNRSSKIRMTNDEIRKNPEIRMTNPAIAPERPSTFGFRISFVICHSLFVIRQQVHGPHACAKAKEGSPETCPGIESQPALGKRR